MLNLKPEKKKLLGTRNGLKIYSTLKTYKKMAQESEKQKTVREIWHDIVQQKCKDLDFTCQWCGLKGLPTKAGISRNCLTGHHIIKRRYKIHTIENCYLVHWQCHDFIETHNINVTTYPTKLIWENRKIGGG